jgi:type IV pilus assembly protein PilE
MRARGFTLVEMMVAVAILGILLGLGVPAYQRHVYRARQHEAQVSLGQVFMAEKNFYADMATFTSCLGTIGVKAENPVRYYGFGFGSASDDTNCGPVTPNKSCNAYTYDRDGTPTATCTANIAGETYFAANAVSVRGDTPVSTVGAMGSGYYESRAKTFTARALGYISTAGVIDGWEIDENKRLFNITPGI